MQQARLPCQASITPPLTGNSCCSSPSLPCRGLCWLALPATSVKSGWRLITGTRAHARCCIAITSLHAYWCMCYSVVTFCTKIVQQTRFGAAVRQQQPQLSDQRLACPSEVFPKHRRLPCVSNEAPSMSHPGGAPLALVTLACAPTGDVRASDAWSDSAAAEMGVWRAAAGQLGRCGHTAAQRSTVSAAALRELPT
jgi:hypothetical protein